MNAIKYRDILALIGVCAIGAFLVTRVMAMNAQNSLVVVARLINVDNSSLPNNVHLDFDFVSNNITNTVSIDVPISGSSREMNQSIREGFENTILPAGNPVLGKNDTLILMGAAEKL